MAELDVIIPVYNEAESVNELVTRVDSSLGKAGIDYNLIFVDDHSTDNTREMIQRNVKNGHSHQAFNSLVYDAKEGNGVNEKNGYTNGTKVKLVSKRGKKGKAYSILEGAQLGNAPYIAMIDGDLQYPPEAIPSMLKIAKTDGVAVANRKNQETGILRKLGSRANKLLLEKVILGLNCDIQSGLKVFRREIIENVSETDVTAWTLDAPLLSTAQALGHKIGSFDIDFAERKNGESKVNFVKAAVEIPKSALKLKFKNGKTHRIKPADGDRVIGAGVIHRGKRFITHSHLPKEKSALQTLVPWQKSVLFSVFGIFLIGLLINPLFSLIFIVSIVTLIYFFDLIFIFSVLIK